MSSNTTTTNTSQEQPPAAAPLPKCRYILDSSTTSTLTLPDGRTLSWAEYGSSTGHAIIYNHGLPASRIEASSYHELALSLGVRIIAPDRGLEVITAALRAFFATEFQMAVPSLSRFPELTFQSRGSR